ncbi:hypothetical protein MPL3365_140231 [Mesorhizobium plurifarium]|uniref:Uncharacterized protein n=1 Tax=Mesorhizobium plurifarium TaxID=69974 RepID=A0A090G4D6_MESPL|nr:hypothetical protein MPL3365_140231 [Mesorhizobium plurifarium]
MSSRVRGIEPFLEQQTLPSSISGRRTLSGGEGREVNIATLGSDLEEHRANPNSVSRRRREVVDIAAGKI